MKNLVTILLTLLCAAAWVPMPVLADAPEVKELSVAPLDHVVYPDSRPDWIDGQSTHRRIVIETGPCEDADQAKEKLQTMLPTTVRSMAIGVVEFLPRNFDPIEDDRVSDYVSRMYTGSVSVGDEEMVEAAAEIVLDDEAVAVFEHRSESREVIHRIAAISVCMFGGLLTLSAGGGVLGLVARRRTKSQAVQTVKRS